MFGSSLFGQSLEISRRILGADEMRKNAIADNIANVDTPNYKRKAVVFEAELNRALAAEHGETLPTAKTDERHFDFTETRDPMSVRARVISEFDTNYRNDKNNVDIEKEMSDEVRTTLHYQAVTQSVGNSFKRLRTAISSV